MACTIPSVLASMAITILVRPGKSFAVAGWGLGLITNKHPAVNAPTFRSKRDSSHCTGTSSYRPPTRPHTARGTGLIGSMLWAWQVALRRYAP